MMKSAFYVLIYSLSLVLAQSVYARNCQDNFRELPLFKSAQPEKKIKETKKSKAAQKETKETKPAQKAKAAQKETEADKKLKAAQKAKENRETKKLKQAQLKEEIETDFLRAFAMRDQEVLKELIESHSFLKDRKIRFKKGSPVDQISLDHTRNVQPQGWGVLQLAVYHRDLKTLKNLLDWGINPRTLKEAGAVSIESNILHIAVRMDWIQGASFILSQNKELMSKRGKTKGYFIDEKDHYKKTALAIAIIRGNLRMVKLLVQYEPSGELEVIYRGMPIDMLGLARRASVHYNEPELYSIVSKKVRVSRDYIWNKNQKSKHPDGRTQPPRHY